MPKNAYMHTACLERLHQVHMCYNTLIGQFCRVVATLPLELQRQMRSSEPSHNVLPVFN